MAGIELDLIKAEILKYIGIPYWKNALKNGKVVREGVLGGKGNSEQIAKATIELAQKQGVDLLKLDAKNIYNFQKKNHIGIDCSGLTYHLLDKLYFIKTGGSIFDKVVGLDNKFGVRKVSARALTSPANSIKIESYSDIHSGDMIRMDSGRHVIFIINYQDNKINYVNSGQKTIIRGVHLGQIEITDPSKSLNFQKWSDTNTDGKNYSRLFYPDIGDGIYRLKCLS